ncbi:hypothetical protein C9374_005230 [Naegleria lovaniensis]|uniref:Response regulatory domain-containing protein n=1 Tax=Naegleria lovaniensis TaxID=51637 RepID=A0AA88GRB0_NAELO|nr:uncharacterized protein C9374_005230 [Naegleria lovaniensis]KAG2382650.1 hypothetical protein C9374_005230 [Naegleria lovaniensis]
MHGQIKVSSALNVGTTVTILLPLENTLNDSSEVISEILRGDDVKDMHVLVIDDDECFQNVLQSYLKLFHKVRKIDCISSVESLATQSLLDTSSVKVIFVSESDYSRATQILSSMSNKDHTIVTIPTIFKGSQRSYSNLKYLTKPVKFPELVDVLSNDKILLKENSAKLSLCDGYVATPSRDHHDDEVWNESRTAKTQVSSQDLNLSTSTIRMHEPSTQNSMKNIPFDFGSNSVLIADDNAVNRKVLVKMLQIIGFKDIDTSNDGMECFEKFKQKSYHLVLLDCFMPILSGREACEMIRNLEKQTQVKRRVPIIAITANTWEPRDTLLSQGFDDVVYKPVILEQFQQLLLKHLDHSSSQQQQL